MELVLLDEFDASRPPLNPYPCKNRAGSGSFLHRRESPGIREGQGAPPSTPRVLCPSCLAPGLCRDRFILATRVSPDPVGPVRDTHQAHGHSDRSANAVGERYGDHVGGAEAEPLAEETEAWISTHLGRDYPWPGNVRELEQCVRSVLIRKEYQPVRPRTLSTHEEFSKAVRTGTLTADELLRRYCTVVYSQTGSYEETARRLQLDRRTVKSKIDPQFLAQLRTTG